MQTSDDHTKSKPPVLWPVQQDVLFREDIFALGGNWRTVRDHESALGLQKVATGSYVGAEHWAHLDDAERHILKTQAVYSRRHTDHHVVSHQSAALLHALPLLYTPKRVHLSSQKYRSSATSAELVKHKAQLPDAEIVEIAGMRCTSLARTLVDLARFVSVEAAVIATDFALRREGLTSPSTDYPTPFDQPPHFSLPDADPSPHSPLRRELRTVLAKQTGTRGVLASRFVTEFASPLAESPLESISRLRMEQVGLPAPQLQVPVRGPVGQIYRLDLAVPEHGFFGECDGRSKYGDDPEQVAERLYQEKRREDWIRSRTGWRCVRWGWREVRTVNRFNELMWNARVRVG